MATELTEAVLYTCLPCMIFLVGLALCRSCNRQDDSEASGDSAPELPQEDPQPIVVLINPLSSSDTELSQGENPSNPSGLV
jgi:hypothetical protein